MTVDADTSKFDSTVDNAINKTEGKKATVEVTTERGNVDLTNRPEVSGKYMNDVGWDVPEDSTATVYTSGFSNEAGDKTIVVTPILPNGDVYSPEELKSYAQELLNGGEDTDGLKIRTYYGEDSVEQANRYAEALHLVQDQFYLGDEAQKASLSSLKDYSEQQLKSIDLTDNQTSAMEDSLSTLMQSMNIDPSYLNEFVDVLSDMGLIKVDVDTTEADAKIDGILSRPDDNTIYMKVDATTDQVQAQLNQLKTGQELYFTANVDNVPTQIEAVKTESGEIAYIANVDGVNYYLDEVKMKMVQLVMKWATILR